ncbi:MAG TPA: alpha/beta hydrolase [Solirubrobacteraceae bacterium]|jgi:pimeloyl-ACP methyl ester carboxylesterase|nr:alpha/beta hydrolase [Solirubrobacteraceae bacterium]
MSEHETEHEAHRWRSPSLGEPFQLELAQGRLEGFQRGEGPTIVFCHGWLANANLWRKVVERLAGEHTCVSLDLPLGAHRLAMDEHADLTPDGCGALIAAALEQLDVHEVTLVGNDSGGAYSQIAASLTRERIARLALNSCETPYDEFPPPPFDGLPAAAGDPETLKTLFGALRDRAVRASPAAFGLLIKHPIDDLVSDSYALPCLYDDAILRDTAKVMASATSAPIHAAGQRLIAEFTRPVLLAWSPEDKVFAQANARRYAEALRDGRLELIGDAYSFTPEDQPQALALALTRFVAG